MAEKGDSEAIVKKKVADIFKKGIKNNEVIAGYDDWSENYEEELARGYKGATIAVNEILRQVPPERRGEVRVLDVAAGTGLVGRDLHREGFRHIDAVEPAEGMMKKLKECGIYTNTYMEPVGTGHSTLPSDTYDLVVIAGGMGEGHIPVSGLDDLVRVSRKGGLVIIVMRLEFLELVDVYNGKLESYMNDLEEQGTWRKVERLLVPNYFYDKEGVVYVYCVA